MLQDAGKHGTAGVRTEGPGGDRGSGCVARKRLGGAFKTATLFAAVDITEELERNRRTLLAARERVRPLPSPPHTHTGHTIESRECVRVCGPLGGQVGQVNDFTAGARRILSAMARQEVRMRVCAHPPPLPSRTRTQAHPFRLNGTTLWVCVARW